MKHNVVYHVVRLPILLVAVFSGLMVYIGSLTKVFQFDFEGQTALSVLLFAIGFLLLLIAGVLFRKSNTTVNPLTPEKTTTLVTAGLYRFSRNPMYVGFLLWLLAVFVFVGSGVNSVFLVLFIWAANRFYIVPEELVLETLFGEAYLKYKQYVRRWI